LYRIGEAQCASPGNTKHEPSINAKVLAQQFDIAQQVTGGIDREISGRITGMR
jgi:hypothetical protein